MLKIGNQLTNIKKTELYANNFLIVTHNKSFKFIEINWQNTSSKMTDEEYKESFLTLRNFLSVHKPTQLILNAKQFLFSIYPDLQEWTSQILTPVFVAIGLEKIGIVVSQDFTVQLSIEQTIDEIRLPSIAISHFYNYEDIMIDVG